jgi:hypothetical protein
MKVERTGKASPFTITVKFFTLPHLLSVVLRASHRFKEKSGGAIYSLKSRALSTNEEPKPLFGEMPPPPSRIVVQSRRDEIEKAAPRPSRAERQRIFSEDLERSLDALISQRVASYMKAQAGVSQISAASRTIKKHTYGFEQCFSSGREAVSARHQPQEERKQDGFSHRVITRAEQMREKPFSGRCFLDRVTEAEQKRVPCQSEAQFQAPAPRVRDSLTQAP